jgi:DNA-directed RNA polymerase subunit alpha
VNHEFSTIRGVKEDVIEILLNLKQIVFTGKLNEPIVARLNFQGPGIITASDIQFTNDICLVEPKQYIATLTASRALEMEFLLTQDQGYSLTGKKNANLPTGFLSVDAVFMPVRKVNFFVETSQNSTSVETESLLLEIETNGSITPIDVLNSASDILSTTFGSLKTTDSINETPIIDEEESILKQPDFSKIPIEDLELSVRAYNCLKRANIHTLGELLTYSQDELLEFKNFGQKSADEVCESLLKRFNLNINKK